MRSSFLHVSSEKALVNSSPNLRKDAGQKTGTTSGLRMLLIEEEPGHSTHEDSALHPKLAFSLAMDAALAAVASSKMSCRGCTSDKGSSCRCCKVALLIPGETKKSRKRRMKSNSTNYNSTMIGTAGKIDFPLKCHQENKSNNHDKMDDKLLNHIHIKYVNSLSDLIKYLVYVPSLPNWLQPINGLFVLGLNDLLSRDSASSLTELTHACK
jgi:hypothetical protein